MCVKDGSLDYIIGHQTLLDEVHVIRITWNSLLSTYVIYDYKTVDKAVQATPLHGKVFADCRFAEKYLDANTYQIGIAGTYFDNNDISNYWVAKFDTKFNFTTQMTVSEDPDTMEMARGVHIDPTNDMMYAAVEINKNKYHNRTVYEPGAKPPEENANIAIIGFARWGIREWITVCGNEEFLDEFADMRAHGNYLYVLVNSFSTSYSTNSSQTDIYYYRLRYETGKVVKKIIYGSATDDYAYSMQENFDGLFVLAKIGNHFNPHMNNDKEWAMRDGESTIALIRMNFDDQIINIEGHKISTLGMHHPTYALVAAKDPTTSSELEYIFAAHRSNEVTDY